MDCERQTTYAIPTIAYLLQGIKVCPVSKVARRLLGLLHLHGRQDSLSKARWRSDVVPSDVCWYGCRSRGGLLTRHVLRSDRCLGG